MKRIVRLISLLLVAGVLFFGGFVLGLSWYAPSGASAGEVISFLTRGVIGEKGTGGGEAGGSSAGTDPAGVAEEVRKLTALGYLAGYKEAGDERGVTVHDPSRAWPGLNFYNAGKSPSARLMDMEGKVLHTWQVDSETLARAFPEESKDWDAESGGFPRFWHRCELMDNGDLIIIYIPGVFIRISRDSEILWARRMPVHHDFTFDEGGRILVLTNETVSRPDLNAKRPVILDYISICTPEGIEEQRVSIHDAFMNSPWKLMLRTDEHDITHTNEIVVLDGRLADRNPAFRKGNVLISCRNVDTLAVIDLETERVVWALKGMFNMQHSPSFLEDGRLLVFDNLGGGNPKAGYSRIVEFDPVTLDVSWIYEGSEDEPFGTDALGACHRLPNGNTMITESQSGRAFEVTREGEIVWEFIVPDTVEGDGVLVASLFELIRIPPGRVASWLPDAGAESAP